MHIIRRVLLRSMESQQDARVANPGELEYKKWLDTDPSVLFIEFMSRGRLDTYLSTAATQDTPFPSQVLWQIFDCCESSAGG